MGVFAHCAFAGIAHLVAHWSRMQAIDDRILAGTMLASDYTFFISNSTFNLSLELLMTFFQNEAESCK